MAAHAYQAPINKSSLNMTDQVSRWSGVHAFPKHDLSGVLPNHGITAFDCVGLSSLDMSVQAQPLFLLRTGRSHVLLHSFAKLPGCTTQPQSNTACKDRIMSADTMQIHSMHH